MMHESIPDKQRVADASSEPRSAQGVRLQKVLAAAGVGSRRYCEILIERGRVSVDGETVREQGTRVDPETVVIHVDGKRIPTAADNHVYMLNKPRGMYTTMADPRGRPCVGDLAADLPVRVFHVGRLDADTEGLLLLTNDGDLANRLTHPTHGVAKTYLARVEGTVGRKEMAALRAGVMIDDRPVVVEKPRVRQVQDGTSLVELTIHEGRNRIVRRVFDALDRPVLDLVRTHVGPLALAGLRPGDLRELTAPQLRELYTAAGL
jgi:23S rRNA pseudouridine2605 synthase